MSIQHLISVRGVARLANQTGATLPPDIAAALDHLEAIVAATPDRPRADAVAKELTRLLGDPAKMARAKEAAVADLAFAEAGARVDAILAEACGSRLRSMLRAQGDAVAAAIGAAIQGPLDILQSEAGKLPVYFRPEQADSLSPDLFGVWVHCRDAWATIRATENDLHVLYAGAVRGDAAAHFPAPAAASLRYAEPARLESVDDAYTFVNACGGRAVVDRGIAAQGTPFAEGLFVPGILAQAGAEFSWGTPTQVTERAQRVLDGLTERPAEVVPTENLYVFR